METQTQTQDDLGQQLQQAVLRAAMPADDEPFNVDEWRREALARKNGEPVQADSGPVQKTNQKAKKAVAVSPRSGAELEAGPGRPKGVKNKLTNLRDAVLEAFEQVGGAQYLAQLAQGTSSDRAAFVGLVSKVLPTQVQAQVEGGVQIQLSWLAARQIGTTAAQSAETVTQVVDMQRDSSGKYRIIDPVTEPGPASPGPKTSDPLPPIDPVVGPG